MRETKPKTKWEPKWLWIIILLVLLVVVIGWFADPLGGIRGSPKSDPTADPTEWMTPPTGPAVEVDLPEMRFTNTPEKEAATPEN
jgi:hypothetical protein